MQPVKEVEFERTYPMPVEKVWRAWTDPEQLKQWWGPDHTSIPECRVDLRVGGEFYIVMLAGEAMGPYAGTRWPMRAVYTVVDENVRLSYNAQAWTEGMEATTMIEDVSELTFGERDGHTTIHLKSVLIKTGPDAGMAAEGMQQGYEQQFEKLATFLAS